MRSHRILMLCAAPWLTACGATPAGEPSGDAADALDAKAEAAAAQRQRELLAEMARRGVFPVEEPAQATVKYHGEDMTYGLYNEAYVTQSEYYSAARTSANYKVVGNIDMGALWKSLEDEGFFAAAHPGIVRVPGASVSVVMRRGQEAWTLAWGPAMDTATHDRTLRCAGAISVLFNATMGLQVIENPDGVDFFERERDRLRQVNADKSRGSGGGR
jgi:hypothetical protein